MSYIDWINWFWRRQATNPVSAYAIALWYAILHVFNVSRWPEQQTINRIRLQAMTGLSLSTLKAARQELAREGFLIYEPSKGSAAATYKLPQEKQGMAALPVDKSAKIVDKLWVIKGGKG